MSNRFNSDDVLARLVREAGDPSVEPDPHYAETLRATILGRVGQTKSSDSGAEAALTVDRTSTLSMRRAKTMKHMTQIAVAATILVAVGLFTFWGTGGGPASIAFADVVKALDSLRSATYLCTTEFKNPADGTTTTVKGKGYFLAPSLERVEMTMSMGYGTETSSILILDCLAAKGITLLPEQKKAVVINIATDEPSTGGTASLFERVRRLVLEGSANPDEQIESLGEKKIDGHLAVGFRTQNNMADMTFWADPQTARLVRIDMDNLTGGGRGTMTDFQYDTPLDRSLFSLEPPAGYEVQTQTVKKPTEEDLVKVLRLVTEHNDGTFPDSIGIAEKTFRLALQDEARAESEKMMNTPEAQSLQEKIKAQYGEDKIGGMKAWMEEWMEIAQPMTQKLMQKYMQGAMFYMTLRPENDSHYAGKGVKLDTPNRPIFWYRPTGADNYRVVYADLSVKEMTPEEARQLPEQRADAGDD